MLIAGEASGDLLAAELVQALREELANSDAIPTWDYQPLHASLEPRFFGAGGPRMAAEGVDLAFDMTEHSVIGLSEALRNYLKFRRLFNQLYRLALEREPDAIICVDFSGFNRRFAYAVKQYVRSRRGWFHDWDPKIIQYVSPQVWASRQSRAYQMARDFDLLLSIFPFEEQWYAKRVPRFPVVFVGHPISDRYGDAGTRSIAPPTSTSPPSSTPLILLLPGSRPAELTRHLPVMLGALSILRATIPNLRARMVLPNETLIQQAKALTLTGDLQLLAGGLAEALMKADLAIASTGTVTLECAYFGVPTVAIYKAAWSDYQVAKRMVNVKYLSMPNLLGNEQIFPEFIQHDATAENIARAALELLRNEKRLAEVKTKLAAVVAQLGSPGASRRAARAIVRVLEPELAMAGSAA
jgi:lipid-A-disaccharide synthase